MKNVLVTGVSRGLGLRIAKVLLNDQFTVLGISRSETSEVKQLLNKYSNKFKFIKFDLSDIDLINEKLFKEIINYNISLYGYINNVAIAYDDIITNLNMQRLEELFKINVFSPMLITKHVIRNMLFHRVEGSIVHISSISVHTGYKGLSMYAATKGALEAFSKNVAREWGERKIRSNCIVAGFMETDMSSKLTESQKNRIYNRTALKSPTNPDDIGYLIKYLLSENSKSITGQNIFVDSGTI